MSSLCRDDISEIPAKLYYPNISEVINSDLRNRDAESLRSFLGQMNIDAEDMEGWLGDAGSALTNIGKTAVKALPQIVPIAAPLIGTAIAGPAGGIAGQVIGGLAANALSQGQTAQPSVQAQVSRLTMPSTPSRIQAQPMLYSSPNASKLSQVLLNPNTIKAVTALRMPTIGAQNISVGSKSVDVRAFLNLLYHLTMLVMAEQNAFRRQNQPWQEDMDEYGPTIADPIESYNRAMNLFDDLQEAGLEEISPRARRLSVRVNEEVDKGDEAYNEAYDEEASLMDFYSCVENWG